jgi:hypothetical protein
MNTYKEGLDAQWTTDGTKELIQEYTPSGRIAAKREARRGRGLQLEKCQEKP